jgi:hypothetical protein
MLFGGADPVHVLGEVADLIKGIPNGELEFVFVSARRDLDRDPDEMALGVGERNSVANGSLTETDATEENEKQRCESAA